MQPLFVEAPWKLLYLVLRFFLIHLTQHLPSNPMDRLYRRVPGLYSQCSRSHRNLLAEHRRLQVPAILHRGVSQCSESPDSGQAMNRSLLLVRYLEPTDRVRD